MNIFKFVNTINFVLAVPYFVAISQIKLTRIVSNVIF